MYDIFYVSSSSDTTAWQIVKSKYPRAQRISNVTSYDDIKSKSFTKMFWVIWDDVILTDRINLAEYTATPWDDTYVHVFKNGEHYDGICLFPRNITVSKREFHHRFFTNKKEINIIASMPKQYNKYSPRTFDEYQQISDDMFWLVWPEVSVIDDSIFNLYFSHHNSYDRRENHVFKNLCNASESYLSGVILCSKYKPLSSREFTKQYAIDKKEHNAVVSRYRYPVYTIASYDSYLEIIKTEHQQMFWCIWPEIEITDTAVFDFYFDPNDNTYEFDRSENHVFAHNFNNTEIFVNGLLLCSKEKLISRREFAHRFLINRKEHNTVVSKHRLYDVVFISYNESNADDNYNKLIKKCPRAKRIHGVTGIHQAHIKAAELCSTDMLWVVDGDAVIEDNFNFDLVMSSYDIDCVHVWRSRNPINDLEYGNGGVKLLPKQLTLDMNISTPDMTTSISKKFKAMDSVSNTNEFNTDEFTTWRSAFRECCKLASRVIERQYDDETQKRLDTWCSIGLDRKYGKYAILGATMGKEYGMTNKHNPEALIKINDFNWLEEQFNGI